MTGVMPMPSEMTHTSVRPSFGQRPGGMNEIAPEVFETVLDQLRGEHRRLGRGSHQQWRPSLRRSAPPV